MIDSQLSDRLPFDALRCQWCYALAVSPARRVCFACGCPVLRIVSHHMIGSARSPGQTVPTVPRGRGATASR